MITTTQTELTESLAYGDTNASGTVYAAHLTGSILLESPVRGRENVHAKRIAAKLRRVGKAQGLPVHVEILATGSIRVRRIIQRSAR